MSVEPKALFAPCSVEVRRDLLSARKDLLWDLRGSVTPKEAAPKLCAQLRLPSTEENCLEVEHQIERTLRGFRNAGTDAPAILIVLQVPLGGDLVLIDKLVWDLNNPRYSAEVHAAALCRDLGLGWMQFVAIAKALKSKIEACRQDLKSDGTKLHVVPPPRSVKRESPATYPVILRAKRPRASTLDTMQQATSAAAKEGPASSSKPADNAGAASAAPSQPNSGAAVPTPARTESVAGADTQYPPNAAVPGESGGGAGGMLQLEAGCGGGKSNREPGDVMGEEDRAGEDSDMPDLGFD